MASHAWIAPVVLVGLWAICYVWTLVAAPGFNVKGKHVLITGATKGLGLAVAKSYARAGAHLTLVGRSMERLETARAAIEAATADSVTVFVHVVDLTVYEQVEAMVAAALAFHGRPTDHVVSTASTSARGFVVDTSVDAIHKIMALNYHAVVNVVKSALPSMIEAKNGGRVVIANSIEAFHAPADSVLVSGAAYALKGFAEALRTELELYSMSVHIFYPGAVAGPYPALVKLAAATPSTPVQDEGTSDYATFDSASTTTSGLDVDALARSLVAGIKMGYVYITTTPSGFVVRSLGNGVVPRVNSMFELMVMPLCMVYYCIATAFLQEPSIAHKEAATLRAASVIVDSV